jgi:hypothetical protein
MSCLDRKARYARNENFVYLAVDRYFPPIGAFVGTACHAFFIRRCWMLHGKRCWFLYVVALPCLFPFPAAIFIATRVAIGSWTDVNQVNAAWWACWVCILWPVVESAHCRFEKVFLDLFITGSLLWRIQTYRKDSPFPDTVALMQRLILLVSSFAVFRDAFRSRSSPSRPAFSLQLLRLLP